MVHHPVKLHWRKLSFSFPSGCLLRVTSWIGVGAWVYFPLLVLRPHLAWVCAGPVHAANLWEFVYTHHDLEHYSLVVYEYMNILQYMNIYRYVGLNIGHLFSSISELDYCWQSNYFKWLKHFKLYPGFLLSNDKRDLINIRYLPGILKILSLSFCVWTKHLCSYI